MKVLEALSGGQEIESFCMKNNPFANKDTCDQIEHFRFSETSRNP